MFGDDNKFTTERLILREMTHDDFDALCKVLGDSDIMRHYPHTFDEKRVRFWIDRNIERYRVFGFGLWAVTLKSTGEMIGDCGLTMQNVNDFIRPEIGYHIARVHQRRGYASEAARGVLDYSFKNTPFGVICSYMKKDNAASSATAKSVGMKFESGFTDNEGELCEVYSISRGEWEKAGK